MKKILLATALMAFAATAFARWPAPARHASKKPPHAALKAPQHHRSGWDRRGSPYSRGPQRPGHLRH